MGDTHYPDSEPNGLGDLKSIKRITGMKVVPPSIKWGEDYNKWPIEKRLRFAERLAATMNHAADILQQERNKLNDLLAEKEKTMKQMALAGSNVNSLMINQLTRDNAEKQALMAQIVAVQSENKKLKQEVEFLRLESTVG